MLPPSRAFPPRPAGTATPTTPAPSASPATPSQPDALARAMADARVWQGVSVALSLVSLWLGIVALRESRAHRDAVLAAERSRLARVAALKTLQA